MALFALTGLNPSNPAHYTYITGTPPVCANPTQQMCTLQADNDGSGLPIITPALKDEMINSLQNQVNGPNVSLKSR
ncbi:hypothetical protein KO02_10090 [Sphingobacterium sp. ML3W]|uniref:hypothetical protein n=1 Tax=Sphingobacterium sp. ML3W TaxID=1538644 RepID=UPI0004F64AD9|nr:hypothetical protein [Sphingobacterium sp. ML3W]AIM37004.1 hypothetical protein KO02_10090 [Sphingobacterium sp. ML3W]